MSVQQPFFTSSLTRRAMLLPLAMAASASWAQTATYGVPYAATAQSLPVIFTTTSTTSGCQTASDNHTVTASVPTTLPAQVPWQLEVGSENYAGVYSGGYDVLPFRLQPSSVVVVSGGVSQSSGQSFTTPTNTAGSPGGELDQSSMTYVYGASVTGTAFNETFKGHQVFEDQSVPLDQQGWTIDYDNRSSYNVATAKQVYTASYTSTFEDPSWTGDNPPGCTLTTTVSGSVTDTLTYSTAPAIKVAQLLPAALVGAHYSAQVITGGNPAGGPYTVEADDLPPGLTLNANGTLTGSPTAPTSGSKTYTIKVYASDGSEVNAPASSQITVTVPASQTCLPPAPAALAAGESWYQLDPAWAALPYDTKQSGHSETGSHTTIGDRGGLLTALAYLLSSAGVPYTPATLDTVIGQHNADFSWAVPGRAVDGGAINIGTAVLDASMGYPAANSAGVLFDRSQLGSVMTSDLDHDLCVTSAPVLLQVNDPVSNYRHYVVATEKAADGYHIIDPGFKSRTNLSAYGGKFRIIGMLASELVPQTSGTIDLAFDIVDGGTLAVYAPGYQDYTGVIGSTSNVPHKSSSDAGYLAIDNAVDSDAGSIQPTSTTYTVAMNGFSSGTSPYTIRVSGLHLGVYYLTIKAAGGLNVVSSMPGIATLGSNALYKLSLDLPRSTMHLTRQGSWTTALQDVNNGQKLGTYGAADTATLSGYLKTAQAAQGYTDAAHQQQFAGAMNAFLARAKMFRTPDVVSVLTGDANALIAGPDYP